MSAATPVSTTTSNIALPASQTKEEDNSSPTKSLPPAVKLYPEIMTPMGAFGRKRRFKLQRARLAVASKLAINRFPAKTAAIAIALPPAGRRGRSLLEQLNKCSRPQTPAQTVSQKARKRTTKNSNASSKRARKKAVKRARKMSLSMLVDISPIPCCGARRKALTAQSGLITPSQIRQRLNSSLLSPALSPARFLLREGIERNSNSEEAAHGLYHSFVATPGHELNTGGLSSMVNFNMSRLGDPTAP